MIFSEPSFLGDSYTEVEVLKVFSAMGIGGDEAFDAFFGGVFPVAPVEVVAFWFGVEFNGGAVGCTSVDDFGKIHWVGLTDEEESPTRVSKDFDVRVFDRFDNALGHGVLVHAHGLVDGGDGDVELGKEFVVEV